MLFLILVKCLAWANDDRMKVVTTFTVIADMAKNVAGDVADVTGVATAVAVGVAAGFAVVVAATAAGLAAVPIVFLCFFKTCPNIRKPF